MNVTAHRLFLTDYCRRVGERRADEAERRFFTSLQLRNGTTKQTASNRLVDVNDATTAYFNGLSRRPESFLDVAVSSGVSTGEWHAGLRSAGFTNVSMTGTDLTLHAHLVEVNRFFRVLVQQGNFPLQYDVFGVPIRAGRYGRRGYVDGTYLLAWLLRMIFQGISARHGLANRLLGEVDDKAIRVHGVRITGLQLISPRLTEIGGLSFADDDLGSANDPVWIGKFEVIRAANILNRGYFGEQTLLHFLKRLRERLTGPGAFLLICRTRERGGNDATLFRLDARGTFEVVLRVGSGSEIESTVLALR